MFCLINVHIIQLSVSEREDDNETTEMDNLSSSNVKNQKKRKNKKKRRTGAKQRVSSEDIDGEDEITRTVKLVDKMFGTTQSTAVTPQQRSEASTPLHKNILQVLNKNLNPHNELKRMFGKVVNQEQQKKRRGGNFRSLKPSLMTNPKESWPNPNRSGIFMNLSSASAADQKNSLYFTFEHSQSYRAVQQKFLQSVESIDSNNIVQIINMQPYHVDVSCMSICYRIFRILNFFPRSLCRPSFSCQNSANSAKTTQWPPSSSSMPSMHSRVHFIQCSI